MSSTSYPLDRSLKNNYIPTGFPDYYHENRGFFETKNLVFSLEFKDYYEDDFVPWSTVLRGMADGADATAEPFRIVATVPHSVAAQAELSTPLDELLEGPHPDNLQMSAYATDKHGRSIKFYDGFWMGKYTDGTGFQTMVERHPWPSIIENVQIEGREINLEHVDLMVHTFAKNPLLAWHRQQEWDSMWPDNMTPMMPRVTCKFVNTCPDKPRGQWEWELVFECWYGNEHRHTQLTHSMFASLVEAAFTFEDDMHFLQRGGGRRTSSEA